MKVIHINSDYGNTIYKNLSDELFELGVEQRVFKFVRPNNSLASEYDDYVDVRLNYNNIDRYFFHVKHNKVVKDFFEYLSDKDADILHAHTLFSNGYIAYQTYLRKNIPYIVTVRNTDVNVFFRLMVHLRKIGIKILLNAERIIFISPAHKEMLFNRYIPNKYAEMLIKKTSIIPNGIDEFYFENRNSPKEIDESDELTVLTAAWINKNKNQINVCKAIQILNLKGFSIKYRIVGGVEKQNTYKKLLEELESYSFVELIPRKNKEELIKEYRQADIFAMVSHKETFGLSYIEALLQCTPIVYTKSQGVDGYFKDGDEKVLTINEKEAEVVRYIFDRYVEGMGCYVIAKELTKLGYKTKRGKTNWGESSVRGILKNEKYRGDLLLGKTFTVDPITHRRLDNFGEEAKYYVSGHHEPIVKPEIYEKAQEIMDKRSTRRSANKRIKREKYSRQYAFSSKMKCAFCGGTIGRRSWHGNTKNKKVVWACITGTKKGKKYCPHSKGISESAIEDAFVDAFNTLTTSNRGMVEEFLQNIEETIGESTVTKKLKKLSDEKENLKYKLGKLVEMNLENIITKETYEEKYNATTIELERVDEELSNLDEAYEQEKQLKDKLKSFRKAFDNNEALESFDREIFENVIDHVIVGKENEDGTTNPYSVTFVFKAGMESEEDISAKKARGIHGIDKDIVYSHNATDTCGNCLQNIQENQGLSGFNLSNFPVLPTICQRYFALVGKIPFAAFSNISTD